MSVAGKTFQTSAFYPVDTVDCSVKGLHIFQSSIILLCISQIGLLFQRTVLNQKRLLY